MKSLILSLVLVAPLAFAQSPQTCVSPGPCLNPTHEFRLIKEVHCEWSDGLEIDAEITAAIVPLAGEYGIPKDEQCERLRDAVQ